MRYSLTLAALSGAATTLAASSLADVCTVEKVQAALPADDTFNGLTFDVDSVTANAVYNTSYSGQTFFPDTTINFCNVTFTYSHNGLDDTTLVKYWLPAPADYQNRFLATGGGGFAINSAEQSIPGGVMYGAVSGITDGSFGGFSTNFDTVNLLANGTLNWPKVYMFGYQGIKEMTEIGKDLTANFYGTNGSKIWTYYQGCSEGGREGWSQAQRAGELYDGIIAGAPAIRYGQQQTNHLFANVVEQTLGYYPPPCELDKIVNATLDACDGLDGLVDGVISRSDLCQLNFNMTSIIGEPYYCAAEEATSLGFGFGNKRKRQMGSTTSYEPEQNGTVSAEGVAVAQAIVDGLYTTDGKRAYISYQIGASFADAATAYDNTTDSWGLDISSLSGEWVTHFLQLVDLANLDSLDGVTYDTLKDWMIQGMEMYTDSLQTTLADLTPLKENGGKVLHFHGEQDDSIPTGSSVHYWESVRQVMYPELSYNESADALKEWYRLYLIPGAAHCSTNSLQPNGPFPQTNLQVMINWAEKNITPSTLNATYITGDKLGDNAQICDWPLRPMWSDNSTMNCVYDQAGIDTFHYNFDAYKLPLY